MRIFLNQLVIVVAASSSLPAFGAPTSASESPVCSRLLSDIEFSKKVEARVHAHSIADDSAPRAAVRATEGLARVERAMFNLRLLELNHCHGLPTPLEEGLNEYSMQAMDCELDQARGVKDSPKCNMQDWQPAAAPIDTKQQP